MSENPWWWVGYLAFIAKRSDPIGVRAAKKAAREEGAVANQTFKAGFYYAEHLEDR